MRYDWSRYTHRGGCILQEDEHGNFIFEEEYPKTYSPGYTIETIKRSYPMEIEQFEIRKNCNEVEIIILIANVRNNEDIISRDMDKCGWYLGHKQFIKTEKGRMWLQLTYEPYYPSEAMNDLKTMKNLLHITLKQNISQIKEHGIVPKSTNKRFSYPPRVHCFNGNCSNGFIRYAAYELSIASKEKLEDYRIVVVDVRKLPEDIVFYYDPNYDLGMFTYDTIPPETIEDIMTLGEFANRIYIPDELIGL